jgi:hypothetical protein
MFNFFRKKQEPQDLKQVLKQFKVLQNNFQQLLLEVEKIKKEQVFSIQKVGLIRYNPFSEVGGNQSFSLALLDAQDNGIVITSLYNREGNRVYSKPIEQGQSSYPLSAEEIKAIELAKNYGQQTKNNNQQTTRRGGRRSH